jgi:hypothetical protein
VSINVGYNDSSMVHRTFSSEIHRQASYRERAIERARSNGRTRKISQVTNIITLSHRLVSDSNCEGYNFSCQNRLNSSSLLPELLPKLLNQRNYEQRQWAQNKAGSAFNIALPALSVVEMRES